MRITRVLLKRSVWKGPHIVPMNIQRAVDPSADSSSASTTSASTAGKRGSAGNQTNTAAQGGATSATARVPPVRTQARAATILPNFVGMRFQVHNGKTYNEVLITEDMVGYKLGEFAMTRKQFSHKGGRK